MKKTIALTLVLTFVLSLLTLSASAISAGTTDVNVWDGSTATSFSGGTGLQNDPYIIKTGAELDLLASNCMGGETYADTYFRLEADIDWGGNIWTPIGYDSSHLFQGHFDGNGQTIYNLECFESVAGLFGCVTEGSVKNLKVDYATFITDKRYCGAIVAWAKLSEISGVSAGEHVVVKTADILSSTAQMGGLVGYLFNSTLNGGTFYGEVLCTVVTGTSFVGGIIGVAGGEASVKNCINYGTVSNPNASTTETAVAYVGGVAGGIGASSAIGIIENCINYGEVSSYNVAGGVLGRVHVDNSVMKNCYNLAAVKGAKAGAVLGSIAKLYVMEGNMGVAAGDAYTAIGEELGSSKAEYKAPGDANLQVASDITITAQSGFMDAEGQVAVLVPIFNLVNPVEVVETTEPETEAPETEPETTEAPETEAPATTEEEKTDAPTETEAPAQQTEAAPTTEAPKTEGGCGGTVALAAILLCILPVAFISKKH